MMNRKCIAVCFGAVATIAVFSGCSAKSDKDAAGSTETGIPDYNAADYVKLGDYKNLEVAYLVPQVTGDDMQMQIQDLVDENTEYNEVTDRPAKEGDSVNIDYIGTMDGKEFDGGSDSEFDLILGSGEFLEDFEKNLEGASIGEDISFLVTFPEDYSADMAGKQAEFSVTVNSISEIQAPVYDDTLIKSVTEYSSMAEYEEAMQLQLMDSATQDSLDMAGKEALKKAVENAKIDGYPQTLYDTCYQETLDSYQSYADMFGMELKEFLSEYMEMDEEGIDEVAIAWVNDILVAEVIAEKEGFTVTDGNYQEEAAALAEQYGYDSLADFEQDYSRTSVESNIAREKVVAFLCEQAKLVEMSEDDYYEQESTE